MRNEVIVKHTASSASDARIQYEIDAEKKAILLSMTDHHGAPLFSSSALEYFVARVLMHDHEIEAYDVDSATISRYARRSEWSVFVDIGDQRFLGKIIRNRATPTDGQTIIELYPHGPRPKVEGAPS